MSDAIAFLLILPALVLAIVVLDAAGTLGTANYRTSVFAEASAQHAADSLAASPSGTEPSARKRWGEMVVTVEQFGLAATAGVCNQSDDAFIVSLVSQPRPARDPDASPSVATVVSCPVPLGVLLATNRIVATSVESVR